MPNILVLGVIVAGFSAGLGLVTPLYRACFRHGSLQELMALTLTVALAAGVVGGLSLIWATDYGPPRGLVFIVAPTMSAMATAKKYYLSPAGIPTLRLHSSKRVNCQVGRITDFLPPNPYSTHEKIQPF